MHANAALSLTQNRQSPAYLISGSVIGFSAAFLGRSFL